MGLFSRFRNRRRGRRASGENVLVISDIHLGEDILDEGPEQLGTYIRALNRELAQFVAHHRQNTQEAKPWHLVINGDMFDFLKVTDRKVPGPKGTLAERAKDLENTRENVVWKLCRVLEVHRPLFKELALFLLDGHRVTVVEGNHDAEFYFDEVRDTLRQNLVELAKRQHALQKRKAVFDAKAIESALQFRTWFVAKAGQYHIEHGHQFDPFCSFAYHLAPYDSEHQRTLATPFSHRAVPYVADLFGDFTTHGIEDWSFGQFVWFIASRGPSTLGQIAQLYVSFGWEFLQKMGAARKRALKGFAIMQRERLKELSQASPYGMSTLERLDAGRAVPVEFSVLKASQVFFFDRVIVGLGMLAGLGAAAVLPRTAGLALGGTTLSLGSAAMWLSTATRKDDIVVLLRAAASRIAKHTGARYIVMGHSHVPEVVRVGHGATYLNSGSWVTREILLGEKGTGMTFVQITAQGATLKRWLGKGVSRVLAPGDTLSVTTDGLAAQPTDTDDATAG